ncbi:hypothetical protein M569_03479 [Genlisea aurea]|uniref:DNA polymerase n=1 Tax=Genlisea aurea TaxID=192259 RepID=S8CV78_9LAMI|nr:hypothetical protein M569_03479 [Genlisea aurea]
MSDESGKATISDDQPPTELRRRTRGAAANARAEALERLKAIRRGGRREMEAGGFQIKMEKPIYDTVDEDEYEALVAKRREEVKGFIVDDNGLGYGDDGQEEDWMLSGVSPSSEESEGERQRPKKRKGNSYSDKKDKEIVKKPPSGLAAAAALMGKQRISSIFASSVFKKDRLTNLSCDSIVDDVIAEFSPDETDRERRRRSSSRVFSKISDLGPVTAVENSVAISSHLEGRKGCDELKECDRSASDDGLMHCYLKQGGNVMNEENTSTDAEYVNNETCRNNGTSISEMEDPQKFAETKHESAEKQVEEKVLSLNAKIEENRDPAMSANFMWQAISGAAQNAVSSSDGVGENQKANFDEKLEFEMEPDGSLPFYIIDAHEEFGANGGDIYLFGKRCMYAIPTLPFNHDDIIIELERNIEEAERALTLHKDLLSKQGREKDKSKDSASDHEEKTTTLEENAKKCRTALRARLHELASELKAEVTKELLQRNVSSLSMVPVKRNYAFERSEVPHGENFALKINYPFKTCKVPSSMWSKIGRLKRSTMPKLNKGNSVFASGASAGIMTCIAGRLLCDTYICSRDLLKEVSYSLTQLAKTQLNKDRKEITPHDIHQMFQSSGSLMELIEYGETDAWLSMELMFHLSVLPLTRQLTNISGNLWNKTLQGARAQRVEYLLLHAFHAKKFIVPDKFHAQHKDKKTEKRKTPSDAESREIYGADIYDEASENDHEYNICFTTVEKSTDGLGSQLPSSKNVGLLPELLRNLVERRRLVKSWLKTASGLKVQQLDIQQQALKLTANSMYGCLGFSNSRFYAKHLAELITLQVIYGDTDSIMIYSGLDDIGKAKLIAGKVIQEVQQDMRNGQIPLEKYVITKTLTKAPEAYPDGRNQPHVEVALRLKKQGYATGCSAGDTVPYVICCEQVNGSSTSSGIAQRAKHPDELKKEPGNWMVDIDYYLSQQIHPVISRLCASIQGTSPSRLADCLGIDSSKYQNKSSDSLGNDPSTLLSFALDDEESSVCASIDQKQADDNFWLKMRCPHCPEGDGGIISPGAIANQVKRQADGFISTYYKGLMTCDDETCNYTTRSINLRVIGDCEPGTLCPNYPRCSGHLVRKCTEGDLYRQLSYFCYTLDTFRCMEKIENETRSGKVAMKEIVNKIKPSVELGASIVQSLRDRSGYGWVQLKSLFP